jgi:diguanylate cyclase (GGDEF)-like protein
MSPRDVSRLNCQRRNGVLKVRGDDTVAEAARRMKRHGVGALVVVNGSGGIEGIITERDIIGRCTVGSTHPRKVRVRDAMTRDVVSVSPGISVNAAGRLMAVKGIRHLPIVDAGKPVGMISARDVLVTELGVAQALKEAAEQIALLSKNLRRLDFQELIGLLEMEVPRLFGAKRWVLYLVDEDHSDDRNPLIESGGCPCTRVALAAWAGSEGSRKQPAGKPGAALPPCKRTRCAGGQVLVPLDASRTGRGRAGARGERLSYLCMCGLPRMKMDSVEALQYKQTLVSDILAVHLVNARLYRAAYLDSLTELKGRRAMEQSLAEEHSRSVRNGFAFCVAMLDVDGFKSINDQYGHVFGDKVLKGLAATLRVSLRAHDQLARYGGDEFVLLMPQTPLDGAVTVVERLRARLEKEVHLPGDKRITISGGVAEWSGQAGENGQDVLRRADAALYEAKRAGRNCVVSLRTPCRDEALV